MKKLSPSKIPTKAGDITLDKDIVTRKEGNKCFLLLKCVSNSYKSKKSISPQAHRIISYLYQVRNNELKAQTPQELESKNLARNSRTISTKIKEIEDICNNNGVKNIFHKFAGNKRGLNPALDCLK